MIAADCQDMAAGGRERGTEFGQRWQCPSEAEHVPSEDDHGRVLRLHGRDDALFQAAQLPQMRISDVGDSEPFEKARQPAHGDGHYMNIEGIRIKATTASA